MDATWILLNKVKESNLAVTNWNEEMWVYNASPADGYVGAYGKAAGAYLSSSGVNNASGVFTGNARGARQIYELGKR